MLVAVAMFALGSDMAKALDTPIPMYAMSYNIRYGDAPDGKDHWDLRKDGVVDRFKYWTKYGRAVVIGVQEALMYQVDYIAERLPDYEWVGVGRDDGMTKGEMTAIFFRKGFTRNRSQWGVKWISSTPDLSGSIAEGARLPRTFTWTLLSLNNLKVLVINTHWDHESEAARQLGAEQIVDFANGYGEIPVILMGDFNCELDSKPIQHLIDSGFMISKRTKGPKFTFNAFNPDSKSGPFIDHIFWRGKLESRGLTVDDSKMENGRYPSDHFPIFDPFVFKMIYRGG